MNPIIPFKFKHEDKNVVLKESCWIDKTPYFTRRAIGEFLEYNNPKRAISNLIKRNPEIDGPEYSVVLNLRTTDGKKYNTRVYDPVGFQLIIMESKQPKAKAYKLAVARLATAYMNGEIIPYTEHYQNACSKRQIAAKRFEAIEKLPFGKKKPALTELAKEVGRSTSTLEHWQTDYRHAGTMDDKRGDVNRARIIRENVPRWREIDRLIGEGYGTREITRMMDVGATQVRMVKSTYRYRYLMSQSVH